jgi:hypothetical protein
LTVCDFRAPSQLVASRCQLSATMSHTSSTPSIRIYDPHSGFSLPHRRPSYATTPAAGAMAIPNAREAVPPPLPPPRNIGEQLLEGRDEGYYWGNDNGFNSKPVSLKPGSSLLGGFVQPPPHEQRRWEDGRRGPRSIDADIAYDDDDHAHGHSGSGLSLPALPNTR